ncbi:HAD family hydrolase [Paenibacillus donghaensis]|uniref:Phosphoglycolate phosphatase n=1 Tax=Paenibacillus donghaensis TaxID=414771 RepID=A0A2Z2KMX6_9BACL|nr:HAD family hydrolase [Paenibacillus donghaensis]ASA21421.1 phosphoglycolate phosphatase [Paenibacillus donghaensis]
MKPVEYSILFDLDGTLTDPKEGITKCVEYALNQFDIQVEHLDRLIPYIGPPLHESFVQLHGFSEEHSLRAVELYRERYREVGMFENLVIPGIPELLEQLKAAGYSLHVATSKPTVFAEQILKFYELDHYFGLIAGSNLDGSRSRKQEVIQYVLDQQHIDPRQAVMIGDRLHDIVGAKGCGMASIGVLFGYGSEEELRTAGADSIAETVVEIEQLAAHHAGAAG